MILYRLQNISKIYDGRTIVNINQLELESEKVYALIGPNGAGKTTLLDLLAFLEQPTTGQMEFMGKPVVFSERHLQTLRRHVILVNQRPILFSSSVFKNMEFGLKIRNIAKSTRHKLIDEALDLVGMRHMINAPAHKLSGGETQRVALARALALSPKVILCDEPTSSVDLESQSTIVRLLKRINTEEKITIVLTSHNQTEVSTLTHQTLFIDQGQLSDALYENLFPAVFKKLEGHVFCLINGSIKIAVNTNELGSSRILINPERIEISKDPTNSSDSNRSKGAITQISAERECVRIVVDIGVSIAIKVPQSLYRQLGFLVGDQVQITIKEDAIRTLSSDQGMLGLSSH